MVQYIKHLILFKRRDVMINTNLFYESIPLSYGITHNIGDFQFI